MARKRENGIGTWFIVAFVGLFFGAIWFLIIKFGAASYYKNEADSLYSNEEYNQSIDKYKQSLSLNDDEEVYTTIGYTYAMMHEYDKAIEWYLKYIEKSDSPDAYTYTNILEFELIQNKPFNEKIKEAYVDRFSDDSDEMAIYDMLLLLKDISLSKEADVEAWNKKYEEFKFYNWSFEDIEDWVDSVEDSAIKEKLTAAMKVIRSHEEEEEE